MQNVNKKLYDIPTNLITGFLGVGKTSAILHLMTQKPDNKKWSVLVNEFGSVGIDGAIYKTKGIQVKEIPGGCMCCAAGVPLQVAINRIMAETKPQRLLIEPSGLGHPKRVIDTLRGQYFKKALTLKATICLLDPRNLLKERYRTHENFIDQIALADILVANKSDLCDTETLNNFDHYASTLQPTKQQIIKTQFGQLNASILDHNPSAFREARFPLFHEPDNSKTIPSTVPKRDGYYSEGWRFPKNQIFDLDKLQHFLSQFENARIKAIMHTNKGWMIFNTQDNQRDITPTKPSTDSRIEIISHDINNLNKKSTAEQIKYCLTYSTST